jgi:hypothetical protein
VRTMSKIQGASIPITILIIEVAICFIGNPLLSLSQENSSSSPQILGKSADSSHCGKSPRCFDAGNFTATVTDIIESQTLNSYLVRIVVRFENTSDQRVVLAYRAHSGFLLDNFENRYFCL